MGSLSKTGFFPSKFFLEKTKIKQRLMCLSEFLLVFRVKKKKKPSRNNQPTKTLNCGSKAFNPAWSQHPCSKPLLLSWLPSSLLRTQHVCEVRGSHPAPRAVGTGHSCHPQPSQCPVARIWPSPCMAPGTDIANNAPSTGIKNINPLSEQTIRHTITSSRTGNKQNRTDK